MKSDTCKTGDRLQMRISTCDNEQEKLELKEERENHWTTAENLTKQMNDDYLRASSDVKIQVITFDLQKTFSIPKAPTNILYYLKNLNLFNLGVHDAKTDRGFFHVWLETCAGRRAQEVTSCLIKFLDTELNPNAVELIAWADTCGGQNRNHLLCLMLHFFLAKQKTLKVIKIRFLQSGHSFNVCDRDFASVERKIKKAQTIYTAQEVVKIMENCRSKNKFKVTQMKCDDFMSVKSLTANITHRDKEDSTKEKVSWLKTHEIVIDNSHPFKLYMKYDINSHKVKLVTLCAISFPIMFSF